MTSLRVCLHILLLASFVAGCTTLNSRNKQIMAEYGEINWEDGIDDKEALRIVRYYMHIQYSHYGVRYLYPQVPEEENGEWKFQTTFRNDKYERNPDQILSLYINKKNGEVSAQLPRSTRNRNSIESILSRFDDVNKEDGISRGEAIDILKHHYYVEAKNRYWMYNVNFIPTESKRYWIFECQAKQRQAEKMKVKGLYLVVNKVSGELFKERSFLSLIR